MNRWFRFYDDAINDPKILKLSDKQHRVWVGLLCIASKNNGQLPSLDDLSLMIRMKPEKLFEVIESLIISGLIDQNEMILSPHNWDKRQYKSDSSTERVKRFRNVTSTVSETGPETEQIQTTEKKVIRTVAKATRPAFGDDFEEFWKVYPKRHGANPKHAAAKLFSQAVKGGADPRAIIEGARRCAIADAGKVGTEFIPQAVKWLRDKRWEDYSVPIEAEIISIAGFNAKFGSEELDAWDKHGRATNGKTYPRNRDGGWRFPTQWPPGYVPMSQDDLDDGQELANQISRGFSPSTAAE